MKRFAEVVLQRQWLRISVFLLAFQVGAQDIPVGTWRTHFSYSTARLLEITDSKVFCAAEFGLFSVDLNDRSTRKLSKIDGLSDVAVSAIKYNRDLNVLAVGYASGYVDLIFEDRIISIEEIANSNLEGEKTVNSIQFFGSQVYCATGLGIVVANASSGEIRENFVQIGVDGAEEEAIELEVVGDLLFARTQNGIQSGNVNSNLLDFNNWTHYSDTENFNNLAALADEIYALDGLNLFLLESGNWADTDVDLPTGASRLFAEEGNIYTATNSAILQLFGPQFAIVNEVASTEVNDILFFAGEFWIADENSGLILDSGQSLNPDGPNSSQFSKIKVLNNAVYGFNAPDPRTYTGSQRTEGYSLFENGSWTNQAISNFQNISDVVSYQGNLFFSSIGDGLYVQSSNEILTDIPGSDSELDTLINALEAGENLWLSSFSNEDPIHTFDGSDWSSFESSTILSSQVDELALSETGILWYRRNSTVAAFDSESQMALPISGLPGSANDIEISLGDDPWVATERGPVNFSDASFIFSSNVPILPSFENRTLFEDERINAIATDGGNRVWFATDRGLWVFDRNISNQEALFNIDNSPLPSDRVLDLDYNSRNGEMFILTDQGMVSYRSASSNPSPSHSNVLIFPNPVTPEYSGLVGIEGLARNVSVKITDVNGNLVKDVPVNGGSASWDLRNVANGEVVTGVYLIFSSSSDGVETYVGKIAVIR